MSETQPFISIIELFNLRYKLGNVVGEIEDKFQRGLCQDLLDIFLFEIPTNSDEIKKKGVYKALVLGTKDLSIINNFVGVNTFALASNENYLISIHRTFREQFFKIDFIDNLNLSEENKRIVTSIFHKKNPETNIERCLKDYPQKPLPSLLIKDFDLSLLQIFDDDIRLLKSTKSIKKITLGISFSSTILDSNNVFSLCRSIDIVPSGYNLSYLNISELTNDFNESKFYNFIILNNQDDFLIQAFLDLLLYYENKLEIKEKLARKVLESIFYISDDNIFSQTRLFQNEDRKYKEAIKGLSLKSSVNQRHNYQAVLLVLSYLEYFFLENSSVPTNLLNRLSMEINQNINRLFNRLRDIIGSSENLKESFNQQEKFTQFERIEISSLWHAIFSSRSTQDILFKLSRLLSQEILFITAGLGIQDQDSSD